ncbi:DUF397 domain-containing protein [Streptomyces sp. NPDC047017]|uniref:DUF397 domain-containing protein n=1 Tax=Streptomyces sp. NPDC047017 TaxID=3155024 RepID=UPI0033FADABA
MALPPQGWHKSTYSNDFEDACVEAALVPGYGVLVRGSEDRSRRPLALSSPAWRDFLVTPTPTSSVAR